MPLENVELFSGDDNLSTCTVNTHVAKHTFCKTCGIHAFYTPRSDPGKIDVNVHCLDDIDLNAVKAASFDGQHWETAFAAKQHLS